MHSVIQAVLAAYVDAQSTYEEMSGGLWLWKAPEYFVTTYIANRIWQLDGAKFLTLENGSTQALQDAGARGRGKLPKSIREKGRVDILLWWANASPRAILEVKNQIFAKAPYSKDIERIKSFLSRGSGESSLQFGIFSFYASDSSGPRKSAQEKVSDYIERIFAHTKSILGDSFRAKLYTTEINEDLEDNAWQAACIAIQRKDT
jgi:hypothetical protein